MTKKIAKRKQPQQQVIFTLSHDGHSSQKVNITFKPGLAAGAQFKKLTKMERYLQNTAADIAGEVLKALQEKHA